MSRLIVLSKAAALAAFLCFAIPAQADEIEPESEPAPATESEPEPDTAVEPEPEPEPAPEPAAPRDDDYARSGPYGQADMAGIWYSQIKGDVKDRLIAIGYGASVEVESPLGLGVRAGYRFFPHLSAEAQFQWFSKAIVELINNNDDKFDAMKIEALTVTGNLKGYLLTGRVQPFVLAGVGLMHATSEDKVGIGIKPDGDSFAARFGGGVDLYVNRNFVIVVEGDYLLPTGKLNELKGVTWSVGLQYRF